jgi:hypothetical protein
VLSWWKLAVRISKSIHGEIHRREDKFGTNIYRKDVDGTLAYARREKNGLRRSTIEFPIGWHIILPRV